MIIRLSTLGLMLAAAPAVAHEEGAFASAAIHEFAHAHAFGGPLGLVAAVAAGAAVALAVSPSLRQTVLRRVRGR